ncbi:MAG: 50S ribosome-binding GTPase [Clostridia bacterium]|nr:50S ribosome-binding GTPase [Clostridia bacterium]
MALLKNISEEKIANPEILSLFGHLIKSNQQVHDFQYILINDYLELKGIPDEIQIVRDVIFENECAVSFEEATRCFKLESPVIQNEFYSVMVIVSRVDGFLDSDEDVYFTQFKSFCGDFSKNDNKAIKQAARLRKLLKKENSKYRSGRRSNAQDNLFRISQKEYLETIKKCREVAAEDFAVIKPVCESTLASAQALIDRIDNMIKSCDGNGTEQEFVSVLTAFAGKIRDIIIPAAKAYKIKINQKEAAVEDFTIVLVGRTKAGKSTLKAVLTGSGKDEIGKGKQRTTLVNYIYEWNNLRIIDTPGIDAGGDAIQIDKDIAEKALAEADVVCYLTPCDGVPKNTIKFIDEIVKSNKPVLILLNYKWNIRDEDNLEDFIDEPDEWRSDKGKNSIIGYYEPIRRFAEENNYEKMITCYPVFLLAALMADEGKYEEYTSTLRKSSGIDEFLASLKIIVVEQGTFLRSKTIIDDSVGHCSAWLRDFRISQENLINQLEILKETKEDTFKKIDKAQKKFMDNSVKAIRQEFRTLTTVHAKKFAETHYDEKDGLDSKWSKYCARIGFEKRVQDAIEVEMSDFSKGLNSIFDDLAIDMGEATRSAESMGAGHIKLNLFPAREVTKFISGALGIAGAIVLAFSLSNPIGWILGGLALVGKWFSGLFKSRAQREREAQDRLYNSLADSISTQCEKTVEEFSKKTKKEITAITKKTKKMYENIQECLETVIKESDVMCREWESQIDEMNMHFAKRVLQYLAPGEEYSITDISRAFGETLNISIAEDAICDASKLEGLIKDKVTVLGGAYDAGKKKAIVERLAYDLDQYSKN